MAPRPQSPRLADLKARVETGDDRHVVHLDGELDLASLPTLNAVLVDLAGSARRIVIDVENVTFIDSSGLRDLLAWRRRCNEEGVEFTVTPGTPQVRRLFEVTGLLDRLPGFGRRRGGASR